MPQLNTPQLPSRLSQLNKPQKVLSSHTICTSPLAPTPMLAPARTPSPCQVLPADDQYAIQLKVACMPPACVRVRDALHFEGKEEVTDRPARRPIDVRSGRSVSSPSSSLPRNHTLRSLLGASPPLVWNHISHGIWSVMPSGAQNVRI